MQKLAVLLAAALALVAAAAQAEILKYRCTSPQVGGQQAEPFLEVDVAAKKVFFPKGNPPQTTTADISAGEVSYVTPYGFYEVKIDRKSGTVFTHNNKRIWVENGTCALEKGN
ncbi:MAG: hypothetical protein ACHQK9_13235 [Reyranellales bacterium]